MFPVQWQLKDVLALIEAILAIVEAPVEVASILAVLFEHFGIGPDFLAKAQPNVV